MYKIYNDILYKPWHITDTLKVYCSTDPFGNKYYIEGTKEDVHDWTQEMYKQYPTAGYGTHFSFVEEKDGIIIYVGTQFHSSD